ncbi:glycerophosphodiester phosphodiesterase family protein [Pedobacter caeni]|uniref:Glycerophosphoryl diester phosphodiesterase n=1 Tax=Pedobacter caeni TaxID=288992 RepID=A0A1M4Z4C2_9SPHI|nr:glycerophosphodiester phosphodiesterase family protein [Pedobacter caeni]SHF12572.1 glycerophosphoryl diester phosphodiesterase [Pedobacter caeni]
MKKSLLIFILPVVLFSSCMVKKTSAGKQTLSRERKGVMVVSHRGDWRNAPENSLWAIRKAIAMGVDMVEIDLAMTKDSVLILMHDSTIDRTTTGKGRPGDFTYTELKAFYLKDGLGVPTQMPIPTLEQALDLAKDQAMLNLDKGFDYIKMVYPMVKARKMTDQVLFKGAQNYQQTRGKLGAVLDSIYYMPIIRLHKGEGMEAVLDFTKNYKPFGFEFTVGENEDHLIDFGALRKQGYHVWVNSLWPQHNAGHNDDLVLENQNVYQWFLDKKVNIIQTDRPQELLRFLKKNGQHQ